MTTQGIQAINPYKTLTISAGGSFVPGAMDQAFQVDETVGIRLSTSDPYFNLPTGACWQIKRNATYYFESTVTIAVM